MHTMTPKTKLTHWSLHLEVPMRSTLNNCFSTHLLQILLRKYRLSRMPEHVLRSLSLPKLLKTPRFPPGPRELPPQTLPNLLPMPPRLLPMRPSLLLGNKQLPDPGYLRPSVKSTILNGVLDVIPAVSHNVLTKSQLEPLQLLPGDGQPTTDVTSPPSLQRHAK